MPHFMAQLTAPLWNECVLYFALSSPILSIFSFRNLMYTGYVIGLPSGCEKSGVFLPPGHSFSMFIIALNGQRLLPGIDSRGISKTLSPDCKVFVQNILTRIKFFFIFIWLHLR